jgi:cyclase
MLKTRIIPTLLYKDEMLVKGVGFDSWRRVGAAMQSVKVYNLREVDELVFVDIAATREGRRPDFATIDDLADECFMPLTVGGGIRSIDDVRCLLPVGADKVALNSAAVETPELVSEIARRFGSQCVVVSIDAKRTASGRYEVYTQSGTRATGIDPKVFAKRVEQLGAGEILLTSIDRDGTMDGYDLALVREVTGAVAIPVVASGGAGSYDDMLEVIREGGASAVAAGAVFHFTQHTPLEAKRHLARNGITVRL